MNFYELGAGLGVVAQAQPRVEIHATARLQSVVARLSVEGLSIESMQQMELDPIDRAKREIDESLHPTPPQTVAKVFAVSGGDVAAGAVEDHALLRAAVQALAPARGHPQWERGARGARDNEERAELQERVARLLPHEFEEDQAT